MQTYEDSIRNGGKIHMLFEVMTANLQSSDTYSIFFKKITNRNDNSVKTVRIGLQVQFSGTALA